MTSLSLCGAEFRKATLSKTGGSDCVEVARRDGVVVLRDDKVQFNSDGDNVLVFTAEQFDQYQAGERGGKTDGLCLAVTERADGMFVFRSTVPGADDVELVFDADEVAAFRDGVMKNEFDTADQHTVHTGACVSREVALAV